MNKNNGRTFKNTTPKGFDHSMQVFKRRQQSLGFSWQTVDSRLFKAAMQAAMMNGVAVMFSSAAGGRGLCMRLMKGNDQREVEYANDGEELNTLLEMVIEAYQTGSEDLKEAMVAD